MKFFFFLISINLTHKSCNTELLRSFRLHGKLVPDRMNVLCPNIQWNCCSKHDQLKIHKTMNESLKGDFTNHYKEEEIMFKKYVSGFVLSKGSINLKEIISQFG